MRGRKRLRKKAIRSFIVRMARAGIAVQTADELWRAALGIEPASER